MHGVGSSCVNAVSDSLLLTIATGGKLYRAEFARGLITSNLKVFDDDIPADMTGTAVEFQLDKTIWGEETLDLERIKKRVRQMAYLNPGLTMSIEIDTTDKDGKEIKFDETYCYKDGIKTYVEKIAKGKKIISKTGYTKQTIDGTEIALAFAYTDSTAQIVNTFVNNIATEEGGDHLTGWKNGGIS